MKAGYEIINHRIRKNSTCIIVSNNHTANTVINSSDDMSEKFWKREIGVWKIKQ